MPRWARRGPARAARLLLRDGIILPTSALWASVCVDGLENLAGVEPPVLFVPNHVSMLDVPVLCRALPFSWRRRVAPAIMAEYFLPWFRPEGRPRLQVLKRGLQLWLAALLFQAFPLPRGQGFRTSLQYAGELVDAGQCPTVFPEGTRSISGVGPFQAGIGLLAVRLGVPLVPVHIRGLERILPPDARWPRRGKVRVRFGAPLRIDPTEEAAEAARRVEAAVRDLAEA